ncbi:MAG TPA: AI-2E family transporter, partial [Planctomycetota bacterium]|nr:AI-2E family transporter [Planctomycetota bacterium]
MESPLPQTDPTERDRKLPPPWNSFVPFLRQLAIWIAFFAILWFLRSFFFLVFLTFVFGYVQQHGVEVLHRRFASRRRCAVFVFLTLLAVLLGLGYLIGPALARQALSFPSAVDDHLATLDRSLAELRADHELVRDLLPPEVRAEALLRQLLAPEAEAPDAEPGLDALLPRVVGIAGRSLWIGSSFLLALLFSFLVVLDLPRLSAATRSLHDTRLRFVYDEVSDSIFHFGRVLGRALEVQLVIAIVNTVLTAAGLAVLGLHNVVFLSAVVFVCSFVPVAGVFVSSVPICLAALSESGVTLMLWAIALIVVIHVIEAYVLNPRIYGAYLRINPVLVLAVLVIGHHLFGVWGMVLGVPVLNYVIEEIRGRGGPGEPP